MQFSILDLAVVAEGSDARQAIANSVALAQAAEGWGYHRFWLAEHHNMPGIASAATAVLIGHIADHTRTIRVGAGGIMLPNHAPLAVAEAFGIDSPLRFRERDRRLRPVLTTVLPLYTGGQIPAAQAAAAAALRGADAERAQQFQTLTSQLVQAYFGQSLAEQALTVRREVRDGMRRVTCAVSDEALEAVLLELLSEFQISIPEVGTVVARHLPYVVLTSNNTRDLSAALKRRCLHLFLDYPDADRELDIIRSKDTGLDDALATQLVEVVRGLRELDLRKAPSISETIDWARTLAVLRRGTSDPTVRIRSGSHGTRAVLTARIPEDTGSGVTAVLEQGPHLVPDAAAREAASGPACWPILVRAWGWDPEEIAAFLDRAAGLTGLADDWPGFAASPEHRLIPADIRAAFRTRPGLRLSSSGWVFRHAVSAVFEQKVTGAEAIGAWQRLTREHADPAPSPGGTAPAWARDLVLPLTPLQWRRIPSWHWRTAGVDAQRSAAVGRLAEAAGSLIRAEEARRLPGGAAHGVAALARGLAAVPGIGPWTVAETMIEISAATQHRAQRRFIPPGYAAAASSPTRASVRVGDDTPTAGRRNPPKVRAADRRPTSR